MNNPRRTEIAKAVKLIDEANTILADVSADESFAFDNMPENLQDSDRASTMEDNVDKLEEACSSLNDAIESLNEIE